MPRLQTHPDQGDTVIVQPRLSRELPSTFTVPKKEINTAQDLTTFFSSTAYRDIKIWLLQLTSACFPHPEHRLDQSFEHSIAVDGIQQLLQALSDLVDLAPPDTGPRRFGNVAFRKWMSLFRDNIDQLMETHANTAAVVELKSYLLESFGSAQRLDYGTGHELSFLAFLGGLWKIGFFAEGEEWSIVAGCIDPYLRLVRRLIKTYTLEPAGSHGVWGLDDHCFLPYILGSAQLAKPATAAIPMPQDGSLDAAPDPATITSLATVNEYKSQNFYYAAIAFILDVKKGPFFEHSPYLYNISGIKDGWGKINKGMLKMYDAEVLGKFPVVQHFGFGSLWEWRIDEMSKPAPASVHQSVQPSQSVASPPAVSTMQATAAPWARNASQATQAPWSQSGASVTTAPWARPAPGSWTAQPPSRPSNLPPARPERQR